MTRLAGVSRTRGNGSREASGGARGRARAATPARRASDGARYALRGERPARDAPEECGAEAAGERDQTCRETRREPRVSRRFFDGSSCDRQDPHLPGGNGHVCPLKMKNAVGWRPPFPSITTTEASLSARGSHKTRARGGGGARREPERASLPSALRESDPVAGAARLSIPGTRSSGRRAPARFPARSRGGTTFGTRSPRWRPPRSTWARTAT